MRLKLTDDFRRKLRALSAQFVLGAVTGSFDFSADAAQTLRTLADEIEKQNK